jgi:hypothetical protein
MLEFLLKLVVRLKFICIRKISHERFRLEYICLKTKPIGNFPSNTPTIHNPEERFYIQPLADHSVLIGGFLRQSKPIFSNGVPDTFHFSLLPDNWDDFRELF